MKKIIPIVAALLFGAYLAYMPGRDALMRAKIQHANEVAEDIQAMISLTEELNRCAAERRLLSQSLSNLCDIVEAKMTCDDEPPYNGIHSSNFEPRIGFMLRKPCVLTNDDMQEIWVTWTNSGFMVEWFGKTQFYPIKP